MLWMMSMAAGIGYFVTIPWHPFPGSIALKGLAVSTLALVAWGSSLDSRSRFLLTSALALSSLGDILLDINASMFVFGLGAFLIAHLCYMQLFLAQRRKGDRLGMIRLLLTIGLGIFAMGFSLWLLPTLNELGLPVMLYIGVLSGMVFTALAWRTNRTDRVVFGAFLFLISDAVLGADKFRGPVPLRGWIVWATYYVAQLLLTFGVLRELGADRPQSSSVQYSSLPR